MFRPRRLVDALSPHRNRPRTIAAARPTPRGAWVQPTLWLIAVTVGLVALLVALPRARAGELPPPSCENRPVLGDMNCDGFFNNFDIDAFVLALTFPEQYALTFPTCDPMNGDADGDGLLNNFDIDPFVAAIVFQPRVIADAGGPYAAECGATAMVQLDGRCSRAIDASGLSFAWSSDCPNVTFDNPSSATPVVTVTPGTGCPQECLLTLLVTATTPDTGAGGNDSAQRTARLFISDTTAPVVFPPQVATVECGASLAPEDIGAAEAVDACDPEPQLIFADMPGEGGGILRRWIATDACGNTASADQLIQIADTTAPIITCVGEVTLTAETAAGVPVQAVDLSLAASDACDPNPTLMDDRPSAVYPVGSTLVTGTARDAAGNEATCMIKVQVNGPNGNNNSDGNQNGNGNGNTNGNGNGNGNGNSNNNGDPNGNSNDNGNANGSGNGNANGGNGNGADNGNGGGANSNDNSARPTTNQDNSNQAERELRYQEEYIVTVLRTPMCAPLGFGMLGLTFAGLGMFKRVSKRR